MKFSIGAMAYSARPESLLVCSLFCKLKLLAKLFLSVYSGDWCCKLLCAWWFLGDRARRKVQMRDKDPKALQV